MPFETEAGTTAFATLSEFLPGKLLKGWADLPIASHAALTLAQLDETLASLPDLPLPEKIQRLPLFGELARWHPLVADPLTAVGRLPIDHEQAQQIRRFLATVMEKTTHMYARLPQQLLHRDYDPGNILVDGQCVVSVLDFEFTGMDLRALDLCIALSWWPVDVMGTGKEWKVIDTFGHS